MFNPADFIPVDQIIDPSIVKAEMEWTVKMWMQHGTSKTEHLYVTRYTQLLQKQKELGSKAQGVKSADLLYEVQQVVDIIETAKMLSHSKSEIIPMVKQGYTESLHQCVAAAMAMKKTAILKAYGNLQPPELDQLTHWIDKKIENKIKMHTEGPNSKPYVLAFEKAVIAYKGKASQDKTIEENSLPPGSEWTPMPKTKAAAEQASIDKAKQLLEGYIKTTPCGVVMPEPPMKMEDGNYDVSGYGIRLRFDANVPEAIKGLLVKFITPDIYRKYVKYMRAMTLPNGTPDGTGKSFHRCMLRNFVLYESGKCSEVTVGSMQSAGARFVISANGEHVSMGLVGSNKWEDL